MPTGLSKEERFNVLESIFLATQNSDHRNEDGFRLDLVVLVKAIVLDKVVSCTCRQRLYGDLRKSPAWTLVKPFLIYADQGCCGPKCGHGKDVHNGPNGECSGLIYDWSRRVNNQYPKCECKGPWVPKDFK